MKMNPSGKFVLCCLLAVANLNTVLLVELYHQVRGSEQTMASSLHLKFLGGISSVGVPYPA